MIVSLAFLLSCKSESGFFGFGKEKMATNKQKFSGTEGLVFEFFENTPPKEVYEGSPFPIGIRLFNKGACDIGNPSTNPPSNPPDSAQNAGTPHSELDRCSSSIQGFIHVGFERDYLEVYLGQITSLSTFVKFDEPKQRIVFSLKSKDIQDPKGGQDLFTFNVKAKDLKTLDPQTELRDTVMTATACYKYKTIATVDTCIDTNVFDLTKTEKVCKVKDLSPSSQGAPVMVTKIEPEMTPKKSDPKTLVVPRFVITVDNKGKGEVLDPNHSIIEGACSSDIPVSYSNWSKVIIRVYIPDPDSPSKLAQLNCAISEEQTDENKPKEGILSLKRGVDKIRCGYEKGIPKSKGTYTTPLIIELDYGYTESISKKITIKRVLTY